MNHSPCPKCGAKPSDGHYRHVDNSRSFWIFCRNHPRAERPSTYSFADQADADEAWSAGDIQDGEPDFSDEGFE